MNLKRIWYFILPNKILSSAHRKYALKHILNLETEKDKKILIIIREEMDRRDSSDNIKLKKIWYYLETRYTKILNLFGITKDKNKIPDGDYCYYITNIKSTGARLVAPCPYYRFINGNGVACTYTGFFEFDVCLYDRCKICKINRQES